jgi:hypothetical protein
MRVVDQGEDRGGLRGAGQEAQRRHVRREAIRQGALRERERAPERDGLRCGKRIELRQQGAHERVQRGERKCGLELHAAGPQHRHALGTPRSAVQQCRLAEPRLASDHEHAATPRACRIEQRLQARALHGTTHERPSAGHRPSLCAAAAPLSARRSLGRGRSDRKPTPTLQAVLRAGRPRPLRSRRQGEEAIEGFPPRGRAPRRARSFP